jgi:hypothetical protein
MQVCKEMEEELGCNDVCGWWMVDGKKIREND